MDAPLTVIVRTLGALLFCFPAVMFAGGKGQPSRSALVQKYRSGKIELHTDLPAKDAKKRLRLLNQKLTQISKYWRRSISNNVVCYLAEDLSKWERFEFPHRNARFLIENVKGAVPAGRRGQTAFIYAAADQGVAEHELVHAYCQLAFGACGPDWYKEGMAEVATKTSRRIVRCSPEVTQALKDSKSRTAWDVVNAGSFTRPISDRFTRLQNLDPSVPSAWTADDEKLVAKARTAYNESWALCHFLCNNPNYKERFRALGIAYLSRANCNFDKLFGPVKLELCFEYQQFLRKIDEGYRVDLCAWDWNREFRHLDSSKTKKVTVKSARGFQPTGIKVVANSKYHFQCEGSWQTSGSCSTTAAGNHLGTGELVGVIMKDFELGKPISMGAEGALSADESGDLYLRCHDDWNDLEDNRGSITVTIQRK